MTDQPNLPPDAPPANSSPLRDLAKAESMVQLALAVPAGCFVGLGIGYALDRHFHTKWIVILGMLLGAAGGFIQIFTAASRSLKRGDK